MSHLAARGDAGYQGKVFLFVLFDPDTIVGGDSLRGIVLVGEQLGFIYFIQPHLIRVQPVPGIVNLQTRQI